MAIYMMRDDGRQPTGTTIAYYPLTSSTTIYDQKGNADLTNNGSVQFGTYQGVSCAYFSGSNYLSRGWAWGSLSEYTESFWFYSTQAGIPACIWFGKPFRGWYFLHNSPNSYIDVGQNSNSTSSTQFTGPSMSAWHLCTVTWDSSACKIYIDGVNKGQVGVGISGMAGGSNVGFFVGAIGNDPDGTRAYHHGYVSEVIIDSTAWTATEVSDYYNLTKGDYGVS